ncbi:MAG: type II toxin-antitoxin system VapC family toxin [Actinomycetota bacterium]
MSASVFVDTAFWIALHNPADAHHGSALGVVQDLAGRPLYSSNLVLGEVWTVARNRTSHAGAIAAYELVQNSGAYFIHVGMAAEREAFEWLKTHPERKVSFVDATSFVLMRSMGIEDVATFDDDFAAAGFTVLTA